MKLTQKVIVGTVLSAQAQGIGEGRGVLIGFRGCDRLAPGTGAFGRERLDTGRNLECRNHGHFFKNYSKDLEQLWSRKETRL